MSNDWERNRLQVQCVYCGRLLERPRYQVKGHRVFCDEHCMAAYDTGRRFHPQCANCGKTLDLEPNRRGKAERYFCDSICYGQWRSTHERGPRSRNYRPDRPWVHCESCGKRIRVHDTCKLDRNDHFFCSRRCYDQWRQEAFKGENNPNWTPKIETHCAACGKPLLRNPSRVGITERTRHFCNAKCRGRWVSEHRTGANSPAWKGGAVQYYGPDWRRQRRRARQRDRYCCRICGKTRKQNRTALHVHHIVPFRDFGYVPGENDHYKQANALTNLITLCNSCHKRAEAGNLSFQPYLL